jgi:hypothetical protein
MGQRRRRPAHLKLYPERGEMSEAPPPSRTSVTHICYFGKFRAFICVYFGKNAQGREGPGAATIYSWVPLFAPLFSARPYKTRAKLSRDGPRLVLPGTG